MQRVTLKNVAEEAGVALSTVSFVINRNRPISDAVKKRVHAAIKKLNYVPNETARMLSSRRKNVIGVLVDNCTEQATGNTLEAINRECIKNSYRMHLNIVSPDITDDPGRAVEELAASGTVSGIINMLPKVKAMDTLKLCRRIPSVTFMRSSMLSTAFFNFADGVILAMDHLWTLGHRRIGFIGGRNFSSEYDDDPRLMGYRQFWLDRGMQVPEELIERSGRSTEEGIRFAGILYENKATAIVCGNEYIAAGVLHWAHANKVEVPNQLSVVAYDDSKVSTSVYPPLTTVKVPIEEVSKLTVRALLDKIEGKEMVKDTFCKPQLIVRNSTGPVPDNL